MSFSCKGKHFRLSIEAATHGQVQRNRRISGKGTGILYPRRTAAGQRRLPSELILHKLRMTEGEARRIASVRYVLY